MARDLIRERHRLWPDEPPPIEVDNYSPTWRKVGKRPGWWVYSLYAAEERVHPPIYIGVTKQLQVRLWQHRGGQPWWPLVGRILVEHFDDHDDACYAEDQRIFALQPLFNIAGNIYRPRETVLTEASGEVPF